jgi:hypothetical protein
MHYLYQTDVAALTGNIQNRGYNFLPLPHVVSLTTPPPPTFSSRLSLSKTNAAFIYIPYKVN